MSADTVAWVRASQMRALILATLVVFHGLTTHFSGIGEPRYVAYA
jgi:hypothetical protein